MHSCKQVRHLPVKPLSPNQIPFRLESVNRRTFLGAAAGGGFLAWSSRAEPRVEELSTEALVVGGGLGGCAAVLALLATGRRVILATKTDWLGGQATTQAAPPDEHPWIETLGCTRTYRAFREAIRDEYRSREHLKPSGSGTTDLNPGDCWVSRLGHEPRFSATILENLLRPAVVRGNLRILRQVDAVGAEVVGDRVRSVAFRHPSGQDEFRVHAIYVLDATDLGDLLALAGAEHVVGAEADTGTGELHAPGSASPLSQQAFTWAMAMEYRPGEDHRIVPPTDYPFWRDHVPVTHPAWTGRLLSWDGPNPATLRPRRLGFSPVGPTSEPNLWTYRRIRSAAQFDPGRGMGDISVVNWPQNDYFLGPLLGVPSDEVVRHQKRAKDLSGSLLHWLQTEAPRPDGGTGWPGLRLCPDVLGTPDGFALEPYIRESRRIRSEFTLTERHIGVEQRRQMFPGRTAGLTAEQFADSIGIGAYRIDLHPTPAGDNYLDISSFPFQIPLGCLLPVRLENLLPAAKNLGVTHITNGCCRVHPVEWTVGEAAGHLAAWSLETGEPPRHVRAGARRLADFQSRLTRAGFELAWPTPQRAMAL